jgi:dihydroorotate dehydrogenase electron transfer subunit
VLSLNGKKQERPTINDEWRFSEGRVARASRVVDQYWRLEVEAPEIARDCGPGQFVMLRGLEWGGLLLARPFDVFATYPDRGTFELLFKAKGEGTRRLAALRPGDRLQVLGPLGRKLEVATGTKGVALVARGAGVAPMVRIAQACVEHGVPVFAVLSAWEPRLLLGTDELSSWSQELVTVTNEQSTAADSLPEETLAAWARDGKVDVVFSCGSRRLAEAAHRVGERYGVRTQLFVESHMACGIGICQGCPVPLHGDDGELSYGLVCVHGPAFAGQLLLGNGKQRHERR